LSKFAIYQVLPRLFGNPVQKPVPNGTIEENGCGKLNHFTNEVLQAIKKLGITHIWYTGIIRHATTTQYTDIPRNNESIVKGKAGSPYAITDYFDVHPDLAEKVPERINEFEELIERTHANGLKALIDFVPNHLSREYKSLNKPAEVSDFGENDNTSAAFNPQNNFYYLPNEELRLPFESDYSEFPAKASGNDVFNAYPQPTDWYETIKLNYGVDYQNGHTTHFDPIPKTWLQMREVLLYWANKGVDGFRCDMAEMVPVAFWEWVITEVKAQFPNIVFIAEIYRSEAYSLYLEKGKFDYLYDKVDMYDSLRAIIEHNQSAESLSLVWQRLNGKEPFMLRFLENHDEQRLASKHFAQYPPRAIPAFFLVAAMHQNPFMLYFGQEFGEGATGSSGFSGNDGRTSIFDYWNVPSIQKWLYNSQLKIDNIPLEQQLLYAQYQEIIEFSLNQKPIAEGDFYDLMWINKENENFPSQYVYAFLRTRGKDSYLCLANFHRESQQAQIIISQHAFEFCSIKGAKLLNITFTDYFSKTSLKLSGLECMQQGLTVQLPPFSYAAYRF